MEECGKTIGYAISTSKKAYGKRYRIKWFYTKHERVAKLVYKTKLMFKKKNTEIIIYAKRKG